MPAHATSEAAAIPSSFVVTFLSALQAAASVLVTIGVGVAAAQFDLVTPESAKHISQLCVNIFLPSLLIANLGSELHIETAPRYIPILSKLHQLFLAAEGLEPYLEVLND